MNKLILLGHPSSGLATVEALLKQSGLQVALPSKRDGLLPLDITDTLCQAHECIAIADAMSEEEFAPLKAGTVWHGLALDLLLGNLQQPLWGWSDSRSIFWLDYWASLDPHATFIMVYDHPVSQLQANALNLQGQDLDMAIPRLMENWQAYNGAMLRFQSQKPQRCLLINAQRAREQLDSYLSDLSSRLHGKGSAALELPPNQVTECFALQKEDPNNAGQYLKDVIQGGVNKQDLNYSENFNPSKALDHVALSTALIHSPEMVEWLEGNSEIDRHLLHQLIQQYPLAIQIYEELEAASSVTASNEATVTNIHPGQAWVRLIQQRQAIADVLLNFYKQMQDQITQINHLERQNIQIQSALDDAIALKNSEQQAKNSAIEEAALERLQKEELHQQLQNQLLEKQGHHDQLKRLEQQLQDAEQTIQKNKESSVEPAQIKELEEENKLLLNQLHLVQEELERYYLENQELQKKLTKPKSKPYGAAERIQQQLSYRLGATMIAHSRSVGGWLKMPLALTRQIKQYKFDLKSKANQKQAPIHTYADAYEAERYQQHLSYKLGQTLIKHGKTPWGWLWMPFALTGTVRDFRKGRE